MKRTLLPFVLVLLPLVSGCEMIGNVFQIGFAAGLIAVLVVVALLAVLYKAFRRGSRRPN